MQITQQYEEIRLQIDRLNRENLSLKADKQHVYPIPIQQTIDHRYEYDEVDTLCRLQREENMLVDFS